MVAITVGVACYNAEAWIEECVGSLFGQTFGDFEIVAINDGSTDRTGELLDALAIRDSRLRVLHQENMGLGLVKNRILRVAKGTWITFVDADDWLAPECLEETHRRAVEEDLDVVAFGWVRVEDGSGRVIEKRRDHKDRDPSDVTGMRKHAFSARLNLMSCASLTKIDLYLDNGLVYPDCHHEDIYVTPFLYFYGKRHGYVDRDFYYWRVRRGSITQTTSIAHIDGLSGVFGSWKARLVMEGRFRDFKGAAVTGSIAFLSVARWRIDKMGRNDAKLLRHFQDQVLSIPELKEYRQHLSPKELKSRANVIKIIKNVNESRMDVKGPIEMGLFPRLRSANKPFRSIWNKSSGCVPHQSLKSERGIIYDVAFAPHKDYHVVTAFPIAEILRRCGLNVAFLDFTRIRGDEGSQEAMERLGEKHCHDLADFIAAGHGFEVLVVFNDWDLRVARPLVQDAREAGVTTVGFVEGINDFADVDTGRRRDAYRSVEWVLGSGENDRRYFRDMGRKFRVVGFPRIMEALKGPVRAPLRKRAVINVNFTYGVLEDKRDAWVASAIEGCQLAGLDWIISQHPQDRGNLSAYPVDTRDFELVMRENTILVSRFSSCIIEALAMGRAVVYHNPETEKVGKFREPLGAYSVSFDAPSLSRALESELARPGSVEKRRTEFLKEHGDCYHNHDLHEAAARTLMEILHEHRSKRSNARIVQPSDASGEVPFVFRKPALAEWSRLSATFSGWLVRACSKGEGSMKIREERTLTSPKKNTAENRADAPEKNLVGQKGMPLVGDFQRTEHAHVDETEIASRLLSELPANSVMVDVGAHHGRALLPFLRRNWKIVALEPDPDNRKQLLKNHGRHPMLVVDGRAVSDKPEGQVPFYTSQESTGISSLSAFTDRHEQTATVAVTTLKHVVDENDLENVDLLKIDAEGHDLFVLKGFPWVRIRPRLIIAEFEDRKTCPLGYNFHDLSRFLVDRGYLVLVSEWHPVVRYGIQHDWRGLSLYPCELKNPDAWGNLIAFRDMPNLNVVEAAVNGCLTGALDKRHAEPDSSSTDTVDGYKGKQVKNTSLGTTVTTPSVTRPAAKPSGGIPQAGMERPPNNDSVRTRPSISRLVFAKAKRSVRFLAKKIWTAFTPAVLFSGLALVGAGIVDTTRSAWLAGPGLVLVGLVIMVEAVVWRRRNRKLRAATRAEHERNGKALADAVRAERERSGQALAEAVQAERERNGKALADAVRAERERSGQALAEAVQAERERNGKALADAVRAERERSGQALAEAVQAERERNGKALADAVRAERERSGQALAEAVQAERERNGKALADAVRAERERSGQALAEAVQAERERNRKALATERSRRSLVDVHLADRRLPLQRILLLFTIHRSGSTWLFDLLRTHPAVRLEPTARVWTELGMTGWRYPGAFHHAEGASVPLEIAPGFGAAIPEFRQADLPDVDAADRWALEKAHPEFVDFAANRLATRIRDLRESGVKIEVVYCVRNPIDSMWSMTEFKERNPLWYSKLPVEQVPQHIANSLRVLAELRDLSGGSVIEYENLPGGVAMNRLGRMLDPSWGDAEAGAWLSHAASVTDRAKRQQGSNAGFLGERDRSRSPDGPDQVWVAHAADIEAANATHRHLVAET